MTTPLSFSERMALKAKEAAANGTNGPHVTGDGLQRTGDTPNGDAGMAGAAPKPGPASAPSGFSRFKAAATNTNLANATSNEGSNQAQQKEEGSIEAQARLLGQGPLADGSAAPKRRFGQQPPASELAASTEPAPTPRRFGMLSPSVTAKVEAAVADALAKGKEEEEGKVNPLPKVIQVFNVAGAAKPQTMGSELSGMDPAVAVRTIQQHISDLASTEDGHLKYEMDKLSEMLTANPSACLYLLDEDIGLTVRALRRMTDNKVAVDMGRAKTSSKASKGLSSAPLTAADMADALDAL